MPTVTHDWLPVDSFTTRSVRVMACDESQQAMCHNFLTRKTVTRDHNFVILQLKNFAAALS